MGLPFKSSTCPLTRSTSPLDDTWISSMVGLSGSVKLFSVKLFCWHHYGGEFYVTYY